MKKEWSTDPSEFANLARVDDPAKLEHVIDAVEQLPKHLKAVIDCLFWEQLSQPAAIRALKISPATFYRRLAEAKRRLAKVLGEDLPADRHRSVGERLEVPVPREVESETAAAGVDVPV